VRVCVQVIGGYYACNRAHKIELSGVESARSIGKITVIVNAELFIAACDLNATPIASS
jgi:hypothetical protein